MDEEKRSTATRTVPTRAAVLAWADAHSLDICNTEADDLVRRLWHPPTPFEPEAVEKCVVDALLLLAESEVHDEAAAEGLRRLAASVSNTLVALGLVERARCALPNGEEQPVLDGEREPDSAGDTIAQADEEDDGAPGSAVGERSGTPLRFDAVYFSPIFVKLHGTRGKAIWPPSFGRVKLKLNGSRRSVVVALDELDDHNRLILRAAPRRLRTEAVVRCRVAHCTRCTRVWIRPDYRIEDTKGEPISDIGSLCAARCEEHRLSP